MSEIDEAKRRKAAADRFALFINTAPGLTFLVAASLSVNFDDGQPGLYALHHDSLPVIEAPEMASASSTDAFLWGQL